MDSACTFPQAATMVGAFRAGRKPQHTTVGDTRNVRVMSVFDVRSPSATQVHERVLDDSNFVPNILDP